MHTSDFTYTLPEQAICTVPAEPRDSAKLLVSRNNTELIDASVSDLMNFLEPGDLIVVNNTKVLPARIPVTRSTGGKGEVFLLHRINEGVWSALVRPSSKIEIGEIVRAANEGSEGDFEIEIGSDDGEGFRVVTFLNANEIDVISSAGKTPLPPYLGNVDIPLERYQTMFAQEDKSVAAPTAGLHFTPRLKSNLEEKGIEICEVTLHVGVGTFRPIMTENIEDHVMHEESYDINPDVWEKILETKQSGRRVISVGTTSLRTIESAALTGELSGSTSLYCYGDFDFKIVDLLFTNFHQPGSSLLVLLDSFMGNRWRAVYEYALENGYRFLSFGDAMLVGRKNREI